MANWGTAREEMNDTPRPTDQEPDAHEASAWLVVTIVLAILGVLVAAALIVCVLLVLWAFFGG